MSIHHCVGVDDAVQLQQTDRWDAPSAAHWITADDPPFFLIVGGADSCRVPQVRRLHEALLSEGAEHPYIVEEGREHQVTENSENIAETRLFFDRELKGFDPSSLPVGE